MKLNIVPDGEGFMVVWDSDDPLKPYAIVRGFATHEHAQGFIRDFIIGFLASARGRN